MNTYREKGIGSSKHILAKGKIFIFRLPSVNNITVLCPNKLRLESAMIKEAKHLEIQINAIFNGIYEACFIDYTIIHSYKISIQHVQNYM